MATATGLLALGALIGVAVAQGTGDDPAGTTMTHDGTTITYDGSHVHTEPLGSRTMPFDVERSRHVFRRLHDGGVQVVANTEDAAEQVRLIRSTSERSAAASRTETSAIRLRSTGTTCRGLRRSSAGTVASE